MRPIASRPSTRTRCRWTRTRRRWTPARRRWTLTRDTGCRCSRPQTRSRKKPTASRPSTPTRRPSTPTRCRWTLTRYRWTPTRRRWTLTRDTGCRCSRPRTRWRRKPTASRPSTPPRLRPPPASRDREGLPVTCPPRMGLQGYLAHKQTHPPRTLPYAYA